MLGMSRITAPAGAGMPFGIGTANGDSSRWDRLARPNLSRVAGPSCPFGLGVRPCFGMHLAPAETANPGVSLFDPLPDLRLDMDEIARYPYTHGDLFLSPTNPPVAIQAPRPA
jgi:cytochrome P450